LIILQV